MDVEQSGGPLVLESSSGAHSPRETPSTSSPQSLGVSDVNDGPHSNALLRKT